MKEQMKEAVYVFVRDNPGVKGGKICEAMGRSSSDREVDKVLQALRKAGCIEFRVGWHATGEGQCPE